MARAGGEESRAAEMKKTVLLWREEVKEAV